MAKRKRKIVEKELPHLWVWYETNTSGGGIKAGQEKDEWPDREDTHHSLEIFGIFRTDPDTLYQERMDVLQEVFDAETVYLVVARYEDGDTFGHSFGHSHFCGIFASAQEAKNRRDELSKPKKGKADSYCHPWNGYFASLEGFEIHEFPVHDKKADGFTGDPEIIRHT